MIDFGRRFTNLKLNESGAIFDESYKDTTEFFSDGVFFKLALGYYFNLPHFTFRPNIGYELDLSNEVFRVKGDSQYILALPSYREIEPDWSGFRIGLDFMFQLPKLN